MSSTRQHMYNPKCFPRWLWQHSNNWRFYKSAFSVWNLFKRRKCIKTESNYILFYYIIYVLRVEEHDESQCVLTYTYWTCVAVLEFRPQWFYRTDMYLSLMHLLTVQLFFLQSECWLIGFFWNISTKENDHVQLYAGADCVLNLMRSTWGVAKECSEFWLVFCVKDMCFFEIMIRFTIEYGAILKKFALLKSG